MNWKAASRLKEPSTWLGLIAAASSLTSTQLTDETMQTASLALAGIAGLLLIVLKDKGSPD